jgi:hypothetical protein
MRESVWVKNIITLEKLDEKIFVDVLVDVGGINLHV